MVKVNDLETIKGWLIEIGSLKDVFVMEVNYYFNIVLILVKSID